jgi:hypothetical protein
VHTGLALVDHEDRVPFLPVELVNETWGQGVGGVHVGDERLALLPTQRLQD